MSAIRVLIADDHLIMREGLRAILREYIDIQCVATAEDGCRAVELAEETHPDVILMDLRRSGLDGRASIAKIKSQWPDLAIVILTSQNEDELQSGPVQIALRGNTLLQRDTLSRLLSTTEVAPALPTRTYPKRPVETRSRTTLSQRELEILKLVATGARNKEIAFQLSISHSTVKAHLDSIFNKLGVDSRTAAVAQASQRGLLFD